MNLYGHVQRIDEERLPQKFWSGAHLEEEEKEVTTEMREKGINNMEWVNKEEWRRKIKL